MLQDEIKNMLKDAYQLLQSGDAETSIKLYKDILSKDSFNLPAMNMLGYIYYFQGNFEAGLAISKKAVEHYPDNPYANKGLGLHYVKNGSIEKGIASLKKAISLDANFTDAYHDLAFVYYSMGDYASARFWLDKGLGKVSDDTNKALFEKFLHRLDALEESALQTD